MAKVAITEQYLTDIADAIRSKTGLSSTFLPAEMAPAILTISGSGGITPSGTLSITANGTYNVTQYASASVNVPVGSTINNQNKTVTPTESSQSVTYDSGYTGLGTVTVGAISDTYVGSAIDVNPTPTASGATVTIPMGYYNTQTTKSVASGTAGTPSASKGTVSNNSITVTPSVTNTTGYITGGIKTGTAVTVSASELVSGNKAISSNGTNIDVTNYKTVSVNVSGGGGITPTGNINITGAGETDVTNYATATVAAVTFVNTISPLVITNNGSVSSSGLVSIPWTINESTYPVYTGGYADEEDEISLWNSGNLEYQLSSINLPSSASSSASSGYTSKATISRSTSDQYINIGTGYNGSGAYYKISAVANGSATGPTSLSGSSATITTGTNTITLTKTGVTTTPTVSAGYVASATASTATVALTASVTVNPTPTASGATVTIPAGYYSSQTTKSVSSGSATAPASISGTAANVSTGTNTLTLTKTVSVTPTVSAGYVSSGTASNSSVSLTASVTTKAAATITPTTSNQTIASGTYLTGTQTISGDANLVAGNIKKDVSIFGVTGSYEGSGSGGSSDVQVDTIDASANTTTTLTFTGLSGEPTSFVIGYDGDIVTGTPSKVAAIVYDGTNTIGQTITNTSNAQVSYNSSSFSHSYSNGTLTVTSSGANFAGSEYVLTYSYGGTVGNIQTQDVQVGSGATSITFTGLDDEPVYWSCIFKSNFSTSSGYQRVIWVEYNSNDVWGADMDSSAHGASNWNYTYNNGSLTITSKGTNQGGYFHQPGYYQLTYAVGGSGGNYQTKSATYYATSLQQTASIAADSGYDALKKVNITIAPVTTTNLIASNIVSGVTVQVGDAVDSDRITSVTGNVVLQHYYTGSSAPSSSLGSNGDLYLQS